MPTGTNRPSDAKIHKILSVAPKLDTITYLSAIIVGLAMYTNQVGMYEQNVSVALLFFTTTLLITNFMITFTIDWLKNEITPHLSPHEPPQNPPKDTVMKTLTTVTPTLRLLAVFISLVFSIIIYYALTPSLPTRHANPYFRYLTSVLLFSVPTIYMAITLYASIREKMRTEAADRAKSNAKKTQDQCQQPNPATSDA